MAARLTLIRVDLTDAALRARFLESYNRIWPEFAMTDREFLHEQAQPGPAGPGELWIVERADGTGDAGVIDVEQTRWNDINTPPLACLVLDPSFRTAAALEQVVEPCERFARAVGFEQLRVLAWERETEVVEFLLAREGWQVTERDVDVQLDVQKAVLPERADPEGVTFTTLAAQPELAHGTWEVLANAVVDIPGDAPEVAPDFEQWKRERSGPAYSDSTMFLALADGRVAGFAELEITEIGLRNGSAWHGFTAVHSDFRGQGIAAALKRRTIEWARANGVRFLRTENEERNAPIRQINQTLGYEPVPARVILRGPISPA
ncbi:MAG: hypothetical protein JWM25_1604 [Thermoleophilia bacterium]|nr:hypothetical protein [Thermoleophilia bacterium]MCZ4497019.1 hypothetical protein [Thermoleophilia bacterium]